ncbi:NAD(P)H-binding protein [Pseudonocardia eucalypti]|uniref:NAD(P)H-binding protein n=1 Tax=Pseudonocardia eucalypti TaxID=648755 RepID=A0ABP9Q4U9_9PSEU
MSRCGGLPGQYRVQSERTILVTGGTGSMGSAVVGGLLARGHRVRVASRRPAPDRSRPEWATVDYRRNRGLDAAVRDVDVVVHCTSGMRRAVDVNLIDNLVETGRDPHLVYISIVGVDRVHHPYYRYKLDTERLVERSGLPHTILRATQFHDLVRVACAVLARPPVMFVPDMPMQSIDTADVAARLVGLATGPAAGRVPDLGGPEVRPLCELAGEYLRAVGGRRRVRGFRLPGGVFAAYRAGYHTTPEQRSGGRTFAEYLAARPQPAELAYRPADPGRDWA